MFDPSASCAKSAPCPYNLTAILSPEAIRMRSRPAQFMWAVLKAVLLHGPDKWSRVNVSISARTGAETAENRTLVANRTSPLGREDAMVIRHLPFAITALNTIRVDWLTSA